MNKADIIIDRNRLVESNIIFALLSGATGTVAYSLADDTAVSVFVGLLISFLLSGWETRLSYRSREKVLLRAVYFLGIPVYTLVHLHQSAIKEIVIRKNLTDFYYELLAVQQGRNESLLLRANYKKELEPKLTELMAALSVRV